MQEGREFPERDLFAENAKTEAVRLTRTIEQLQDIVRDRVKTGAHAKDDSAPQNAPDELFEHPATTQTFDINDRVTYTKDGYTNWETLTGYDNLAHLSGIGDKTVEINFTAGSLTIGVHTDTKTLEAAQALLRDEEARSRYAHTFETIYHFDRTGQYEKICKFPFVIPDDRPDPQEAILPQSYLPQRSYRTVMSEMTPGDFELAGLALTSLREQLLAS